MFLSAIGMTARYSWSCAAAPRSGLRGLRSGLSGATARSQTSIGEPAAIVKEASSAATSDLSAFGVQHRFPVAGWINPSEELRSVFEERARSGAHLQTCGLVLAWLRRIWG